MRIIHTLLFLVFSISIFGQQYQRLFRPDDNQSLEVIDCAVAPDGTSFMLSRFITDSSTVDTALVGLHLTAHNLKGDVNWKADVTLEEGMEVTRFGDMKSIGADTFLIAFYAKKDNQFYQGILRTNTQGLVDWSYTYLTNPNIGETARPVELAVRDNDHIYLATTRVDTSNMAEVIEHPTMWLIDSMGRQLSFQADYTPSDTTGNAYNVAMSEITYHRGDSTIVMSGKVMGDETKFFVAKVDTAFNQVWAYTYAFPSMLSGQVYDQYVNGDGTILLTGTLAPAQTRGFIAKISKDGELMWINTLFNNDPSSFGLYTFALTVGNDGNIAIGGTYLENFIFSIPFVVVLNQAGNLISQRKYTSAGLNQFDFGSIPDEYEHFTTVDQGNIVPTPDGGYLFGVTELDAFGALLRNAYIIKIDDKAVAFQIEGEVATCHASIDIGFGTAAALRDTLQLNLAPRFEISEELIATNDTITSYSTPILGFVIPLQCPNDINVELNAALQDAIQFEWSTGDTTPTITVFDQEEYSVTVTMDGEYCFQLCDTVKVEVFPQITGFIDLQERERYCTDREFSLEILPDGGDGTYTYLWDTGDTTKQFYATEVEKLYSVTITDGCGEQAVVTRTIFWSEFEQPDEAEIVVTCADDMYVLTLLSSGTFDPATVTWSTAETGVTSIMVADEGQYSATFIDNCMYQVNAEIEFSDITAFAINYDGSNYCSDGVIFVSATLTPQSFFTLSNLKWSTGSGDDGFQAITVTEFGTYMATITDNCGNEFIESVTVPDLSQTPETLMVSINCTAAGLVYTITNPNQITLSTVSWNDELGNIIGLGVQSITLSEAQVLTVTAIDDCQNPISASFTIEDALAATGENIGIITNAQICDEPQEFVLTASFSSGVIQSTIVWSTGEMTQSITVDEAGTYSVSAIDQCGFEVTDEVTINPDDFFEGVVIDLQVNCLETGTTITANAFGDVFWDSGYIWNNGEITPTIFIPEDSVGTYTVTVVDICNNIISDSTVVNQGNFFPCECVSWPNLMSFETDTSGARDSSFGPLNNCGELVTDYEMYIYNAFGNLLFQTNDFGMTWDGSSNGDIMPSGVYMFYSSYIEDGVPTEKNGELTLIR